MRKIILTIVFFAAIITAHSQSTNKKIYYLADTINVSKNNRVLQMGYQDNGFEYYYLFYCNCIKPFDRYVAFYNITKHGEKRAETLTKKPDYKYISFKDLMELVSKNQRYFDDHYDLYITEVLPKNKFRTDKVIMVPYQEPVKDFIELKNK